MQNLKSEHENLELLNELQTVLQDYLNQKSNMSLNGLSKKCTISEPTLRRILKGQVKTLPNITTILDILITISGDTNTENISKKYPGPISKFLKSMIPQIEDCNTEYNSELNVELKTPIRYLIFKLASNATGVSQKKVTDLFGIHGISALQDLLDKGFVIKSNEVFFSKSKNFTGSHNEFVTNFKSISDFIKTRNSVTKTNLNPLLANYSESISFNAYKEIVKIQKKSLQKIRAIMSEEKSKGPVPLFVLSALDTLDFRTAYEIEDEFNKSKRVALEFSKV